MLPSSLSKVILAASSSSTLLGTKTCAAFICAQGKQLSSVWVCDSCRESSWEPARGSSQCLKTKEALSALATMQRREPQAPVHGGYFCSHLLLKIIRFHLSWSSTSNYTTRNGGDIPWEGGAKAFGREDNCLVSEAFDDYCCNQKNH